MCAASDQRRPRAVAAESLPRCRAVLAVRSLAPCFATAKRGAEDEPQASHRHGRRRAGRVHRRRAPHLPRDGRAVRTGRGRLLERSGEEPADGRRARARPEARLRRLERDGRGRGEAAGRAAHPRGLDRHAQRAPLRSREARARTRLPRHLRQAAHDHGGGGRGAREARRAFEAAVPVTHNPRAPDGARGGAPGAVGPARRDPQGLRQYLQGAGSATSSRRPDRSRRAGASTRRSPVRAARWGTSGRTRRT